MGKSARNSFFILFSVALIAAMAAPLRQLISYALATDNTHASQIVLVPFISAALIYMNRKRIFKNVNYAKLPGMILMMMGFALLVGGVTVFAQQEEGDRLAIMTASMVVMWLGGFLLFYGSAAFKAALFPLLFLAFFIPIPSMILDRSIDLLRRGSTDMAFVILKMTGMPILREGFYFRLPNLTIEVAAECSGIRSGISLLISSLLAGHLFLRTMWRKGALVLLALPVLIFKNALRISTLSYLAVHLDPRILTSQLHREGGIPFFVLGIVLLSPVLALLAKSERKRAKMPAWGACNFEGGH